MKTPELPNAEAEAVSRPGVFGRGFDLRALGRFALLGSWAEELTA